MYGKWVVVPLGDGFEVRVYVSCTPDTPAGELATRARQQLMRKLIEFTP